MFIPVLDGRLIRMKMRTPAMAATNNAIPVTDHIILLLAVEDPVLVSTTLHDDPESMIICEFLSAKNCLSKFEDK